MKEVLFNPKPINAGALLTIDLSAICANWRALKARVGSAECAAVIKADAYGLGAVKIAPALYGAGCRQFFVAHLTEAIDLRPALPSDAAIYVLHCQSTQVKPPIKTQFSP
ncbi:alanine racemase [Cupriavidus pinatubonensis]|uniref:Alanine racemase n=1 Tax=Cupriavidus pinatubonensis TaxID=248026 RepID=A0ABM8Y0K5_9BURK|nr:alanine racemase [Cupriavidus pinatubonensis]CAG9186201.1 Alanine racemase [Cupriavidus pinatubonensis]